MCQSHDNTSTGRLYGVVLVFSPFFLRTRLAWVKAWERTYLSRSNFTDASQVQALLGLCIIPAVVITSATLFSLWEPETQGSW